MWVVTVASHHAKSVKSHKSKLEKVEEEKEDQPSEVEIEKREGNRFSSLWVLFILWLVSSICFIEDTPESEESSESADDFHSESFSQQDSVSNAEDGDKGPRVSLFIADLISFITVDSSSKSGSQYPKFQGNSRREY